MFHQPTSLGGGGDFVACRVIADMKRNRATIVRVVPVSANEYLKEPVTLWVSRAVSDGRPRIAAFVERLLTKSLK
jgi:hypothetical protein